MKIAIIGAGFVGLSFAAVLGSKGYEVLAVDSDKNKVKEIKKGNVPFYEPNLSQLLKRALKKSLGVSTDTAKAAKECDLIFITVGTPVSDKGVMDLGALKQVANEIGKSLAASKNRPVLVIKSTVAPGTSEKIKKIIQEKSKKKEGKGFSLISNPEFLREGKAIQDTLNPHIVVIGGDDKKTVNKVKKFYEKLYKDVPFVVTNPQTAELIKYANNSFLATKISFINQIANICQSVPGTSVDDVAKAIGIDPRIGSQFLRAGPGYGGSCLPKDLRAFISFSENVGQNPILLKAVNKSNAEQVEKLIATIKKALTAIKGKKITVLGLSFKEDSDDIRESASISLIKNLLKHNVKIIAHDPMAINNTRKIFGNKISYADSISEALKDSQCAIIMTPWRQYSKIKNKEFHQMRNKVIIDTRRMLSNKKLDVKYYATGLGPIN